MNPVEEILIALVIFCGSSVQTIAGFGFGLVAVPLFLVLGLSLPTAVLLAASSSLFNTLRAAWVFRAHVPIKEVLECSVIRLSMAPVGLTFLFLMERFDPALSKVWAGWIFLVLLAVKIFSGKRNLRVKHGGWLALTAAVSGFLATSIGVGGPPMVFWSAARGWKPEKQRSFTLGVFATTQLPIVALLIWRFPREAVLLPMRILYILPVLFLGVAVGHSLSKKIPSETLEIVMNVILLLGSLKLAFGV